MTVLTFPTIVPQRSTFGLRHLSKLFTSPFSGQMQTAEFAAGRWTASLLFEDLDLSEWRTLSSFMAQLRGQAGRFYLYDHFHPTPSGAVGGAPLVNGAGQTGNTLTIDGCSINITGWLLVGDYFHFDTPSGRRELKKMTANANTNGTGETTLTFEPPIRESPANNAPITTTNPSCIMMLEQDEFQFSNEPLFSDLTINCMEAVWVP